MEQWSKLKVPDHYERDCVDLKYVRDQRPINNRDNQLEICRVINKQFNDDESALKKKDRKLVC